MRKEGPPQPDQVKTRGVEIVSKRLRDGIARLLLEMPNEAGEKSPSKYLLERLADDGQELFPEHYEAFERLIEQLREIAAPQQGAGVPEEIIMRLSEFMVSNYTLEELERRLRLRAAEREGWTKINEALSYGIEGDEIGLHVPMMLTKSPPEMLRLFKEALTTLAEQLENEPGLKNIQAVKGYSWIVYTYPEMLERLGFSISEQDTKKERALAMMSREDFLSRYGQASITTG